MKYNKKTLNDINLENKRVILRLDLNVPMKDGEITNDNRIIAAIPTIEFLINKNAKIIILSHLGRIKNNEDKQKKSLKIISEYLQNLFPDRKVEFNNKTIEKEILQDVNNIEPGNIMILENTRFYDVDSKNKNIKFESKNDPKLGKFWASLGDVFVNDAFGTAHRSHASNVGISKNIKESCIGLLIENEINMLSKACDDPKKPLIVVLGGSKISDKIKTIKRISKSADKIIIGGGMAYTFLKAQGHEIGKSLLDETSIPIAKKFIDELGDKLILPIDHVCSNSFENGKKIYVKVGEDIPTDFIGLDIGKKSIKLFNSELKNAKTIIWNGPLGMFEKPEYSKGTKKVCKQIAKLTNKGVFTLIGGGDSAAAAIEMGYKDKFSHISTGGGASLSFLEGESLVGIEPISNKNNVKK